MESWQPLHRTCENLSVVVPMTSRRNNALRAPSSPDRSAAIIPEIAGRSERIRRLREEIVAVAPIDSTVLLAGPTGCGKGRVARAHRLGDAIQGG